MSTRLAIGTAGWAIPRIVAGRFPDQGSSLERYSALFNATEINSSFYRPHRRKTYARWADSVPPDFQFAVKLPKAISHAIDTREQPALVERIAEEASGLGAKLAVLLVQFPPRRGFDPAAATELFGRLSAAFDCAIACEPRHASWFGDDAGELLARYRIARVAADPPPVPAAAKPGGWAGLRYHRLHGSPAIYRSSYDDGRIAELGKALTAAADASSARWCIFDNTAGSHAAGDALALLGQIAPQRPVRTRLPAVPSSTSCPP